MKYIVILADGMSDRPLGELNGKTPLNVADKPNMDLIAERGTSGLLNTMYPDLPLDSGVANLAILGYDPRKYYPGRGPLEAARLNLKLGEKDIAMRCNLVTEKDEKLDDFSAGHIGNDEAAKLITFVNEKLGTGGVEFYPGVSYRNIIVLRDNYSERLECKPPHDIIGKEIFKNLIKPQSTEARRTAELLNELTLRSRELLGGHEINKRRAGQGKNPANMIWLWGPGRNPKIPSFESMFGIGGSVISAVDIIKGIAQIIGLNPIDVPGATGYIDTNYEGKVDAALKSLKDEDFVFIHLESTDEAGHEGSIEHKVQAIEDIDKRVVGRLMDNLEGDYSIGVLPDHATSISLRTHTDDPVPFSIYSTKKDGDSVQKYSENDAAKGSYGVRKGTEFMGLLLAKHP